MKKQTKVLLLPFILFSSLNFFSCRDMLHDMKELKQEKIQPFKMLDVSDSLRMNTYETTYQLWYEVRQWGMNNGYRFVLPGKVANKEVTVLGLYGSYPVSSVHPADVIVWMNAFSEKNNLTPVYYEDSEFKTVLRNAFLISNYQETQEFDGKLTDMNGNPLTTYDFSITSNFYTKSGVDGYRLPTQNEWLTAARSGGKDKLKYGVSDDYHDVAALGYVHQPGQYIPNSFGLYDTIGNVEEIMLDGTTYSAYAFSYLMDSGSGTLYGPYRNNTNVYSGMHMFFGFRIAQTVVE